MRRRAAGGSIRCMRLLAACGIAGPAAFVGGWLLAGGRTEGYSPVAQPISDLAAEGAPTRALMTSAFVGFGVLVPLYARALGQALDSRAVTTSVALAGVATLGVAAFPLSVEGGQTQDLLHAVTAGSGYAAMAASPLVGGLALLRLGRPRAARVSFVTSAVSAGALLASVAPVGEATGLLQRTGLTVVDAWFASLAAALVLRRLPPAARAEVRARPSTRGR